MVKVMKEFLNDLKGLMRRGSHRSFILKRFHQFIKEKKLDLYTLTEEQAKDFISQLTKTYSLKTVYTNVRNMKFFYAYLIKKRKVKFNPFVGIQTEKPWEIKGERKKIIISNVLQKEFIKVVEKRGIYGRGTSSYFDHFNKYLDERHLYILSLKPKHAQEFQSWMITLTDEKGKIQYSKNTVGSTVSFLKIFYQYLKEKKLIVSNPFADIQRVKTKKELPKILLDEKTLNKLLGELKNINQPELLRDKKQIYKTHVATELIYSTGIVLGEVIKLKLTDIDFEKGTITVDEKSRILNEYTLKVLKIYVERMRKYFVAKDCDLVFNAPVGFRTSINQNLKKSCKKLGIEKITTKDLRHALGYHLVRGGCDIRYIKEVMAHGDLHTTQRYLKLDKKDLKNVIDQYHPRNLKKEKA